MIIWVWLGVTPCAMRRARRWIAACRWARAVHACCAATIPNMKRWKKVCKPTSQWSADRVAFEQALEAAKDKGLTLTSQGPAAAIGTGQ